jgi:hypothetical protein
MAAPDPTQTFLVDIIPAADQTFAVALNPAADQTFAITTMLVFETGRNILFTSGFGIGSTISYEPPEAGEQDITLVPLDFHWTTISYDPDAEGTCEVIRPDSGLLYPRGDR